MEVRVRERLIGALVLVAVVVMLVPAILKGRAPEPAAAPGPQLRRVEVPVGNAPAVKEEAGEAPVPEPSLPAAAPRAGNRPPVAAQAAAPPRSEAAQVVKPADDIKPAAKAPAAVAATSTGSAWAVQLAAFASREKADQLVGQLRQRGYAAFVLEYRASGKVLYRVRVGPEQDRNRAEATAARLAREGFQPVVARHP